MKVWAQIDGKVIKPNYIGEADTMEEVIELAGGREKVVGVHSHAYSDSPGQTYWFVVLKPKLSKKPKARPVKCPLCKEVHEVTEPVTDQQLLDNFYKTNSKGEVILFCSDCSALYYRTDGFELVY